MTSVLSARDISVSFGGVRAVVDVDLDVEPGQLVGLIGPNGAGKTTFVDAITGFVPHRGTVTLAGTDITGSAPHVRAAAASPGRGSRSSCSTTCRCGRTSPSPRITPRCWRRSRRCWPGRSLDRRRRRGARGVCARSTSPRQPRASSRRVSASSSLSPGRWRPAPRCCASTNRRPALMRTSRSCSAATCARSSIEARRSSSWTTTWASCSGSPTTWWCSSSAR